MKKYFAVIVFVAVVLTSFGYFFDYKRPKELKNEPEKPIDKVEEKVGASPKMRVGEVTLELEIASTTEARERGLSYRQNLSEGTGMLFIFERPAKYSFWMKDMNFPIDMIWLDESFKVTGLKVGATPSSYPKTFSPERDSLYVLETNVGLIKSQNLKLGTQLEFIK